MRLSVDHRTTYRFTQPQARLVQMLRMTPCDTHDQTVADWRIDVDCDARLKPARDGFGNKVTMLYAEGPIETIEIAVSGEVLTAPFDGVLNGAAEPFPPALYCRTTPLTEADATLAYFAGEHGGESNALTRLHAVNRAIADRFEIDFGSPMPGRTAVQAFGMAAATPRDLAHVFIAVARQTGVPARFVSGYSLVTARGGTKPTRHGWAEAHVEGLGWVAFDPTTGRSPGADYVRVAIGLDAAGASPVAGSRLGEGGDEDMAVDVTVEQVGE